jgi:hypothetical protein
LALLKEKEKKGVESFIAMWCLLTSAEIFLILIWLSRPLPSSFFLFSRSNTNPNLENTAFAPPNYLRWLLVFFLFLLPQVRTTDLPVSL